MRPLPLSLLARFRFPRRWLFAIEMTSWSVIATITITITDGGGITQNAGRCVYERNFRTAMLSLKLGAPAELRRERPEVTTTIPARRAGIALRVQDSANASFSFSGGNIRKMFSVIEISV